MVGGGGGGFVGDGAGRSVGGGGLVGCGSVGSGSSGGVDGLSGRLVAVGFLLVIVGEGCSCVGASVAV